MGARGPVPNRDSDLARPRARKGAEAQLEASEGTLLPVDVPEPLPHWGELTMMAYDGLLTSGMRDFYQNSDWAYAFMVLDEFDAYRLRSPIMVKDPETGQRVQATDPETGELLFYPTHRLSGQMFQALMTALSDLGMSEGGRRRMRIELQKPAPETNAQLYAIQDYMNELEESN